MLKILQSPMGAALIPQMHQRENMVMDTAQAGLQETLGRTANAADQNRRANEMHPLEMDSKGVSTQGQRLVNQGRQNDLTEYESRGGPAGAAVRADEEDDYKKLKRTFDVVGPAAEYIKRVPIGQKRNAAAEIFSRGGLPKSVLDALQNLPEEQVDAEVDALAKGVMNALPKVAMANTAADAKRDVAGINAAARRYVSDNSRDTALRVAQLKAEIERAKLAAKKAAGDKKGGGGNGDDVKNSNLAARYYNQGVQALRANKPDEAEFYFKQADTFSKLLKRKDDKPMDDSEQVTEIEDEEGNVLLRERKRKTGPGGTARTAPPAKAPSTSGWGNATKVDK